MLLQDLEEEEEAGEGGLFTVVRAHRREGLFLCVDQRMLIISSAEYSPHQPPASTSLLLLAAV